MKTILVSWIQTNRTTLSRTRQSICSDVNPRHLRGIGGKTTMAIRKLSSWNNDAPLLLLSSSSKESKVSMPLTSWNKNSPLGINDSVGSKIRLTLKSSYYCYYSTSSTASSQQQQPQEMKDEYGTMDDSGYTYVHEGDFVLENGQVLPQAQLRYKTYGELNAARDNVIVVCHALTGNASLHTWWGGLLGPQKAFDTSKYFIICCNILGSAYGSSGPMSENPTATNNQQETRYGMEFPDVSVQDTVRLQLLMLQNCLRIRSIKSVIGGSFGGMQVMEYAVQGGASKFANFFASDGDDDDNNNHTPQHHQQQQGGGRPRRPFVQSVIPIACGSYHTAWQIAISETQRQAIYKDPQWSINPLQATNGLQVARQIAMISYRTHNGYSTKFGRRRMNNDQASTSTPNSHEPDYGSQAQWQAKSYLEYQGLKFIQRFDPITYVKMTEQMDSHDIARGRADSDIDVLNSINIPALVMGIDSDLLYPLREQEHLARHMPNCTLQVIRSEEGHDGFLLEQDQVGGHITKFLQQLDQGGNDYR